MPSAALASAWLLASSFQKLSHLRGILGKQSQAVAALLCLSVSLPIGPRGNPEEESSA